MCRCFAMRHATLQVLEVWFTWHAMGLLQQHFALAKAFLQSLARSLHKQDGYDGLPMVQTIVMGDRICAACKGRVALL